MNKLRTFTRWVKKHGLNIFTVLFLIAFVILATIAITNPIYN